MWLVVIFKNSEWLEWTEWTKCSITCGKNGRQSRTRDCEEEIGGCIGIQLDVKECFAEMLCPCELQTGPMRYSLTVFFICKVDGIWKLWSDWTPCDIDTCMTNRTRVCVGARYGGKNCTPDENGLSEIEFSPPMMCAKLDKRCLRGRVRA